MKITCKCGGAVSDNAPASKASYIKSLNVDKFWERIDDAIENSGPSSKEKEAACMNLRRINFFNFMLQCSKCKRLIFYGKDPDVYFFKPEADAQQSNLFYG